MQAVLSLALVAALLGLLLPAVTGSRWSAVLAALAPLSAVSVAGLLTVWLLGLYVHTFLATAALPDLSHRQALTLNFCGSAISNVLPLGGAAGMAVNLAMLRSWRFRTGSFGPFVALTTFSNVLSKLLLPGVGLGLLVVFGARPTTRLLTVAGLAAGLLVVLLVGAALLFAHERSAAVTGRFAERAVNRTLALGGSSRRTGCERGLVQLRAHLLDLLRARWRRMLASSLAYALLQALLLGLCLSLLGSALGPLQVLVGYAFGRLLSLLVVTPGGVGLTETGTAALLVALGGDPTVVTAATLLYTAITFGLEIPVGAVCTLLWWRGAGRAMGAS